MHEDATTALDRLFEAALVPGLFPDALDKMAQSLGAVGAAIVPKAAEKQLAGFPTSQSVAHVMEAYVRGGWYLQDLRGERSWRRFAMGDVVVIEHEVSAEEERRRLPYYQELFGAFGLPWWAAIGFSAEGGQWGMALFRDAAQGAYEPQDVRAFADIAQHLRRIVTLTSRFRQALDARTVEIGVRGHTDLITLDQGGLVLDVSPGAALWLGTLLNISHRRLSIATPQQDRFLQPAIRRAVQASTAASQTGEETIVVPRGKDAPLLLDVISLPGVARDVFTRAVAVVILRQGDMLPSVSAQTLQREFGLTLAECRLAVLVGAGRSLNQASVQLNITVQTARTVLKRIFSKLGVSRQAELVALLTRLSLR